MDSKDIITVITAILSSGALATVIQLTANRFRVDRRADLIRSWKEESDIADTLYKEAISIAANPNQISQHDSENDATEKSTTDKHPQKDKSPDKNFTLLDPEFASRNSRIAFSRAVRSDLNKRLSLELVPSNAAGILFSYLIALVFSLGGLFLTATGIYLISTADNDPKTQAPPISAGILVLAYGAIILIVGIAIFYFLYQVEQSRMRARKIILDILNIDSTGSTGKIKIENNDLVFVDGAPKLFIKSNKLKSNETTIHLKKNPKPKILKLALGRDLTSNLETFIRQTTTKDTYAAPKFIEVGGSDTA